MDVHFNQAGLGEPLADGFECLGEVVAGREHVEGVEDGPFEEVFFGEGIDVAVVCDQEAPVEPAADFWDAVDEAGEGPHGADVGVDAAVEALGGHAAGEGADEVFGAKKFADVAAECVVAFVHVHGEPAAGFEMRREGEEGFCGAGCVLQNAEAEEAVKEVMAHGQAVDVTLSDQDIGQVTVGGVTGFHRHAVVNGNNHGAGARGLLGETAGAAADFQNALAVQLAGPAGFLEESFFAHGHAGVAVVLSAGVLEPFEAETGGVIFRGDETRDEALDGKVLMAAGAFEAASFHAAVCDKGIRVEAQIAPALRAGQEVKVFGPHWKRRLHFAYDVRDGFARRPGRRVVGVAQGRYRHGVPVFVEVEGQAHALTVEGANPAGAEALGCCGQDEMLESDGHVHFVVTLAVAAPAQFAMAQADDDEWCGHDPRLQVPADAGAHGIAFNN